VLSDGEPDSTSVEFQHGDISGRALTEV